MKSAVVFLPIRCPDCQKITNVLYTRSDIAALLHSTAPFRVFSACHDVSWIATEADRLALLALIKPSDCVVSMRDVMDSGRLAMRDTVLYE